MRHKFFHIPVLHAEQAENELNQFCGQHRIAHVEKQFVDQAENSFWAICVTWLQGEGGMPASPNGFSRKPKIDYKEVLSEDEFRLFSKLRDLRKTLAEQEGTPVYTRRP